MKPNMFTMADIARKLEKLGAARAPLRPDGGEYLNHILLGDPPGVYFILGTDNPDRREKLTSDVQLIFLRVPREQIGRYAVAIGYRVKSVEPLDSPEGPIPSAILEPL